MNAIVRPRDWISVEDYLATEETSPVKREYIAGCVYAMAGTSVRHNRIAGNLFALFHGRLRGDPCQAFFADVKLHIPCIAKTCSTTPTLWSAATRATVTATTGNTRAC